MPSFTPPLRFCNTMRKAFVSFLLPALFLLNGIFVFAEEVPAGNNDNLTLMDCYKFALKQSEVVAIKQEMIREAEGQFVEYINRALPKLTFYSSEKHQNGAGDTSFTLSRIPERRFNVHQTLFSGFKELATIAATRYTKKQRQQEKLRAEQLLFSDVSDAFYLLLSYDQDIEAMQATHQALVERIEELKKREELGRSRQSEIANAEVNLNQLEAEYEGLLSDREVGRQLLAFLTGAAVTSIVDAVPDESPLAAQEDYVAKAGLRPDVLAVQEAVHVAHKQTVVAKSGYWPVVSADGNYYTERVGNTANVDWDATLDVTVPISDLAITAGHAKTAAAQQKEAELTLQQAKRNAVLEIQNAYTKAQSSQKKMAAMEKALAAAEKNYELQKADYSLSLVNNLTVLSALQQLQDVKRGFIAAKMEARQSYWNLKVATGEVIQ